LKEEGDAMVKDQKPYLVFACANCGQYSHVKTTQKTKKCLRCGRSHQVRLIKNAETVFGMNAAVETVKQKQAGLALARLGKEPDLESFSSFILPANKLKKVTKGSERNGERKDEGTAQSFKRLLEQISSVSTRFPEHSIQLLADEFGIPKEELPILVSRFIQKGVLRNLKNGYLKVVKNE